MLVSRREWLRAAGLIFGALAVAPDAWSQEPVKVAPPPAPPGGELDPLLEKVLQAIAITSRRQLRVGEFAAGKEVHSPWQVVHGILALRQDLMVKQDDGSEIQALEWIARGATWKGEPLFEATEHGGRGHPFSKAYDFEGHPTQFLGYMCEVDLPLDFLIQTPTKPISIGDIIKDAQMSVTEGPEVTWTLWALSHYLEPDAQWVNAKGEPWSIERMLRIQIQESVLSGACGGCHGLYALAYARNRYLAATKRPLSGVWLEADYKVKRYINEARALQNSDGSFSANYFRGPEYSSDFTRRLPANGHILELLMVALPESELHQQWVRNGVYAVAQDLIDNRRKPADCGPLFHALHALKMYNFRVNSNAKAYSERPPFVSPVPKPGDEEKPKPEAKVIEITAPRELAPAAPAVPPPSKPLSK